MERELRDGTVVEIRRRQLPDGGIVTTHTDITARKRGERQIQEQHENMALLNRVAHAANESESVNEALGNCLREICLSMSWPVGHAYLHSPKMDPALVSSKVWHIEAGLDITPFREMTEASSFNKGKGLPGLVVERNAPVGFVKPFEDNIFPRAKTGEELGLKSGIAFPASIGEEVVAVLEFFSLETVEPDRRVVETLGNIGQQLGGAILRKIAEHDLQQAYSVISESVEYASNIQRAALPFDEMLEHAFEDYFIIWEPRDVVGGDIYWCLPIEDGHIFAVADCTGHGVPGAFITLVASGALRYAMSRRPDAEPAAIIAEMNHFIKEVLAQYTDDSPSDDGLELGVCRISSNGGGIDFAGARFSLWQLADGGVQEVKGDKTGVGYCDVPLNLKVNSQHVEAQAGDQFYMLSDGIIDQVGGDRRRAFGKKRLFKILQENIDAPMQQQQEAVVAMLSSYQANEKRRDDVTMVGFKL